MGFISYLNRNSLIKRFNSEHTTNNDSTYSLSSHALLAHKEMHIYFLIIVAVAALFKNN